MKAMKANDAKEAMKTGKGKAGGSSTGSTSELQARLDKKIAEWKAKQEFDAPLNLNTEEQKALSSKFHLALRAAPADKKDAWSEAGSAASGSVRKEKQGIVKAWLMDKSWGRHLCCLCGNNLRKQSFQEEGETGELQRAPEQIY